MIVPVPVEAQVPPFGIERFEEGHLLFPPPTFDLFFSMDCVADIRLLFEIHQPIEPVLAGKAWNRLILVFVNAPLYVIS
jgi:hypothetical protein